VAGKNVPVRSIMAAVIVLFLCEQMPEKGQKG